MKKIPKTKHKNNLSSDILTTNDYFVSLFAGRVHATQKPAMSVGTSVGPSVGPSVGRLHFTIGSVIAG